MDVPGCHRDIKQLKQQHGYGAKSSARELALTVSLYSERLLTSHSRQQ